MNPATYLRVLGPEPWNVAYPEPSIRPDDSRYGENPNRVQRHTQFQVILKPDPGNPQELYLKSLEVLGIDVKAHDIRFVEDNWESPALGAWGLGWEVWMDGMEVTQFTYFQQAGGFPLDVVSVEITYGLERIIMALQGALHFKDIEYGNGITYGEVFLQNEYEMSVYNLDAADVDRNRRMFDLYEEEAKDLISKRLPIPAHQCVLKTSHVFNILDARGAIGVTERARYFARMRNIAKEVASLWIDTRLEAGHPLLRPTHTPSTTSSPPSPLEDVKEPLPERCSFVLEIGSEELPPDDVTSSIQQLRTNATKLFESLRLNYTSLEVFGTPRRLALVVKGLLTTQPNLEKVAKGPPAAAAFPKGSTEPSKAAVGFAKAQGVRVEDLQRQEIGGTEYVIAIVKEQGKAASDVLAASLTDLVASISFGKSMRWNSSGVSYSRPIRWLVALLHNQVIPCEYAGVTTGKVSRGYRSTGQSGMEIPSADDYLTILKSEGVVLSPAERKSQIWEAAQKLAADVGGEVATSADSGLLDEVANLVEGPTPLMGRFEDEYLALPREVLVTVMRKHQRYFPVQTGAAQSNGTGAPQLLPYFITVANGAVDMDVVRHGNEAVIRARYADARFFWKHDISKPLDSFIPLLSGLTFQENFGSMLDKNTRVQKLALEIAKSVHADSEQVTTIERAAGLAKADLATQMVVEFTNLAGVMGQHYAVRSGEVEAVGRAIYEHVLPRFAGDDLPTTLEGAVLAVADRIDSLVGLFAAGLAPKSTADPFALRRTGLGMVQTLVRADLRLDLRTAISQSASSQPIKVKPEVTGDVLTFVTRRFEQWLLEQNYRGDLVNAVLDTRGHDPALALTTLKELSEEASTERFARVLTTYGRPARLARSKAAQNVSEGHVDPKLFDCDEEKKLWHAFEEAQTRVKSHSSLRELISVIDEVLAKPIDSFFDNVFVMSENPEIKTNRIRMLRYISALSNGIVDLTVIQGF